MNLKMRRYCNRIAAQLMIYDDPPFTVN